MTTYPCENGFEKVVDKSKIPEHYLAERGVRFSRKELDKWLIGCQ